ncbi:DUF397 domain-containing protein [Streptosporangium carneum]|uniref:DUF397 domain-containing protein n=1 Tax=Streptosporangium carneum TaxID=47481 RepID=A0A9W6HW19_9ACTN|nr:DUF397 domain-containing protein [Streptosporangium carneum]GLK07352.1 hypothetical protein GCM10017600_07570 [Streptosporangium carneum]
MISPDLSGAEFRKSSLSGGNNNCVEVATNLPGVVAIRDSKDPSGPALTFSATAWGNFLEDIRSEGF